MSAEPIRILIHLEGGCVTGVACSNDNAEVMIIDHDDDKDMTEEEAKEVEDFAELAHTWIA